MRTYLYISYKCNCNCFFCASDETNKLIDKKEVDFAEAKEFLLKSPDKKNLIISGGEPTIHQDFLKIVSFANQYYENITLLTNGIRFADADFLKATIEAGVNRIAIPFYSPYEREHNIMVGNTNAFNNIINALSNINCLLPNGSLDVRIKLLLAKFTYKSIPDSIDFLARNYPNIKHISLNGLHIGAKALQNADRCVMNYRASCSYNDLAIQKLLEYGYIFQLCEIPLCAFSYETVEILLSRNIIANVDEAYLKRPDKKTMIVSSSVFIPEECSMCSLANICPKIYGKNAQSFDYGLTPFLSR